MTKPLTKQQTASAPDEGYGNCIFDYGAQKGYWNFASEKLLPLVNFLSRLK
ncbi:MAG: hypothetical protein KAW12_22115 [Candidatus Aminicenantes bacterium]|nr:hypothetical protein [Candidatus Aminicenantes bacterium]